MLHDLVHLLYAFVEQYTYLKCQLLLLHVIILWRVKSKLYKHNDVLTWHSSDDFIHYGITVW